MQLRGAFAQVAVEINRLRAGTTALLNRCLRLARIPGLPNPTAAATLPITDGAQGLATEVSTLAPFHCKSVKSHLLYSKLRWCRATCVRNLQQCGATDSEMYNSYMPSQSTRVVTAAFLWGRSYVVCLAYSSIVSKIALETPLNIVMPLLQEDCISAGLPAFAREVVREWNSVVVLGEGTSGRGDGSREEEAATGLARCLEWSLQYSVEVLSSSRAAAEHIQVQCLCIDQDPFISSRSC